MLKKVIIYAVEKLYNANLEPYDLKTISELSFKKMSLCLLLSTASMSSCKIFAMITSHF